MHNPAVVIRSLEAYRFATSSKRATEPNRGADVDPHHTDRMEEVLNMRALVLKLDVPRRKRGTSPETDGSSDGVCIDRRGRP
jgi:hypothetical protein